MHPLALCPQFLNGTLTAVDDNAWSSELILELQQQTAAYAGSSPEKVRALGDAWVSAPVSWCWGRKAAGTFSPEFVLFQSLFLIQGMVLGPLPSSLPQRELLRGAASAFSCRFLRRLGRVLAAGAGLLVLPGDGVFLGCSCPDQQRAVFPALW